jgi:hypothetical protein
MINPDEAYEDGFSGIHGGGDIKKMMDFFHAAYGFSRCVQDGLINKLTLYWINKYKECLDCHGEVVIYDTTVILWVEIVLMVAIIIFGLHQLIRGK